MSQSTLTAHHLLRSCGVSDDTSYYADRPATMSDVNGEILIAMYKKLRAEESQEAADAFVKLVRAIKPLSAVNFIQAIRRFEKADWQFNTSVVTNRGEDPLGLDGVYGDQLIGAAFGAVMSGFSASSLRDETSSILWYFDKELEKLAEEERGISE